MYCNHTIISKNIWHLGGCKPSITDRYCIGTPIYFKYREVIPILSERSISPMVMVTNQRKAALREKQDSKQHKKISIKFSIIVCSTTGKYGKLIYVITLSGGFYPFCCGYYKDITKLCGRVIFY